MNGRHLNGELVGMLQHVLEGTGQHPLDLLFYHYSTSPVDELNIMRRCFNFMISHSVRWRRVEFVVHRSCLLRLSVVHRKVDWLTDAHLQCWGNIER